MNQMEQNTVEQNTALYREQLNEKFSIRHKITSGDEKHTFHIHDQFELMFLRSDGMRCLIGNKTYLPPRNTLLLLNNMDLHYISKTTPGKSDRYVVYFSPEYASCLSTSETDLLECFFFRPFSDPALLSLDDTQAEEILQLLSHLSLSYDQFCDNPKGYGNDLGVRMSLARLLLQVNRLYRGVHNIEQRLPDPRAHQIYAIMHYLHQHYDQELSLDFLSETFFMNKYSLCNLFKSVTGTSINQYLIQCRLMKAKELLLNHIPVEEVCSRVGYNNLSHFSRSFKKQTGLSPKQYQMSHIEP